MLRAGEALLALSPLLAAALLYGIAFRRLPSRRVVWLLAGLEVALVGALVWQSVDGSLAPHEPYVPAHIRAGQVIAGHGAD